MNYFRFVLIFSLTLLYSCNNKDIFKEIKWLNGNWESEADSSQFIENWQYINDSLYKGEAFVIAAGETVFSEKITIEKKGGDIFYNANVSDQNNGEQVSFRLISQNNGALIFEKKDHDFPSKIYYTLITADSLLVKIEGIRKGMPHAEYFPFRRKVE